MPANSIPVRIISPAELAGGGEIGPFPIEQFERRCLAQGDSWFSIGAIPPFLTTNLLLEMELTRGTCIVNCATPAAKLKIMVETTRSRQFLQLLTGRTAGDWDAVLVSGGGNDLIAALLSTDDDPSLRLLAREPEWGTAAQGASRYLSAAGWLTFSDHLRQVFADLVAARDSGRNAGKPIVFHTYDVPAPRDAAAGPGFGPWLSKALKLFNVPEQDWNGVADQLFAQLHQLLTAVSVAMPALVLVDSLGTLHKAPNAETGLSGDWLNEIHPTREGYDKLGEKWRAVLDDLLG